MNESVRKRMGRRFHFHGLLQFVPEMYAVRGHKRELCRLYICAVCPQGPHGWLAFNTKIATSRVAGGI